LFRHIRDELLTPDTAIISPDAGGVERARSYAWRLGAGLAILDKRRSGPNEAEVMHIVGDVSGRRTILVDDMIDTAGTLVKGAGALRKHGATDIFGVATHAVLSGPAIENIDGSVFESVFVTDTIPLSAAARACARVRVPTVAPLFAEAIRSIHFNDSISRLFLDSDDNE
jgi:ribose-phosphate pyrophosphokinase